MATSKPTKLLSGGNPQIGMADGDAPVQAYIAAVPVAWKRSLCVQLDALVMREAPHAVKAVKWNSPFYGVAGQGWFVSFHVFTQYVKLTFFKGTRLKAPPTGGAAQEARWINITAESFDAQQQKQVAAWVKQAAAMPGWGKTP